MILHSYSMSTSLCKYILKDELKVSQCWKIIFSPFVKNKFSVSELELTIRLFLLCLRTKRLQEHDDHKKIN